MSQTQSRMPSFKLKPSRVTILQGVELQRVKPRAEGGLISRATQAQQISIRALLQVAATWRIWWRDIARSCQ